jgi:oligoribonuclease NrnB/cAMP/cGMP phosphodiesterase (DHH superfamily)
MLALPKPEVICTHESDLDGFVAGLLLKRLARKIFDADVPVEAYHNHNWHQRPMNNKSAWICDLSFEARVDRPGWVVIDHHPTDTPARRALLIHDLSKSAGLLCYELCREHGLDSPPLDRLVHLSDVADLFLEDDPDFAVAQDYANLVKTYQFWNLYELIEGELERLLNHPLLEVMEVKRRVENPLGYTWSKANITELSQEVGFVDTVVGNINLIVHQLLERQETPYLVLVTLFRKGTGTVIASLRSRDGSALRLAEKLQGGGHPNASGATLPRSVQNIPDAIEYLRQVLNPAPAPVKDLGMDALEGLLDSIEPEKKQV